VKNEIQDTELANKDSISDLDINKGYIKTTNVNILLNRVRLDKQKTLKKRIIFSIIVISFVVSLAVYLSI
tara:strand:- start:113 stop:322 length:210 start_codon:yes stop_codon:yes gene_type:complete